MCSPHVCIRLGCCAIRLLSATSAAAPILSVRPYTLDCLSGYILRGYIFDLVAYDTRQAMESKRSGSGIVRVCNRTQAFGSASSPSWVLPGPPWALFGLRSVRWERPESRDGSLAVFMTAGAKTGLPFCTGTDIFLDTNRVATTINSRFVGAVFHGWLSCRGMCSQLVLFLYFSFSCSCGGNAETSMSGTIDFSRSVSLI